SLEAHGGGSYLGLNAPAATFVAMGLGGALGCYAGGSLADRWGRTTLTMAAMALAGLCAATSGLTFGGPPALTIISIWLIPPVVRLVDWPWAFALLAPGPALGVLAMARLRAAPEAVRMA